jgi:hypothetical protein
MYIKVVRAISNHNNHSVYHLNLEIMMVLCLLKINGTSFLDFRAFAFYHPEYRQWITEDGSFDLLIGASAADIRCRLSMMVKSTLALPCLLDMESTLREWMVDPHGARVLGPMYQRIEMQTRKIFCGARQNGDFATGGENTIGLDIMDRMVDTPQVSVLMFQQGELTIPMDTTDYPLGTPHAMDITFKFNNETPTHGGVGLSGNRSERVIASHTMSEL